jgi:hypothetical protein
MRALEKEERSDQTALFDAALAPSVLNPTARKATPRIEELVLCAIRRARGCEMPTSCGHLGHGVCAVSALMGAFANALWRLNSASTRASSQALRRIVERFRIPGRARRARCRHRHSIAASARSELVWTPLYSEPMVLIVPRRPHFPLPRHALDILGEAPFIRFRPADLDGHLIRKVWASAR